MKKNQIKGDLIAFAGILILFISLINYFFISKSPLDLFFSSIALILAISGIFLKRGYYDKKYYGTVFAVILCQGLILIYIYAFTLFYSTNTLIFYCYCGIFILFSIIFVKQYLDRGKDF
jgi:hypothetical protein